MSLSVEDLLKEFDDLPGGQAGRTAKPASYSNAQKSTVPPILQHQGSRSQTSASTGQLSTSQSNQSRPRSVAIKKKDDLESLLSDLDFGGTPYNSMTGRNNPKAEAAAAAATAAAQKLALPSRVPSSIAAKQKCTGLFVGGTRFPRGRMGAVGNLTCCDALRCTKCDFRVEQFNDRDWTDDVDYLFFRNNFPTEEKLAAKMRSRPGTVAYCCQCSWLSSVNQTKLDFSSEVRWVCAGHLTA